MSGEEASLRANAAWWGLVFTIFDDLSTLTWNRWRWFALHAWDIAMLANDRWYRNADRAEFLREIRERAA